MRSASWSEFPIKGVVGVLAEKEAADLDRLEKAGPLRPDAIEIRADLFEDPGRAVQLFDILPEEIPIVFTVRLPAAGGHFAGDEADRIRLYHEALRRGASLVDAEWETEAARVLAAERAPLVVSYHDFHGMTEEAHLDHLTHEMETLAPMALKIVPTALEPVDGIRMLQWVGRARRDGPRRIGFAMGEAGMPSRILSQAWGSPFTYAAIGDAVAPGQLSVREMKGLYRSSRLTRSTRVLGVVGSRAAQAPVARLFNPGLLARGLDAVCVPLCLKSFSEVLPVIETLGIDGLSVLSPFQEDALKAADQADERARSTGAANTLVFERKGGAQPRVFAHNTDPDGILGPLSRRGIAVGGLSVGILGTGESARSAAMALRTAGATVTLYTASIAEAKPVAEALGLEARSLDSLTKGHHRLLLNAADPGAQTGDTPPVGPQVFEAGTVAFDTFCGPLETPFLAAALSQGAPVIRGFEMVVCRALPQFKLLTGKDADHGELEGYLKANL